MIFGLNCPQLLTTHEAHAGENKCKYCQGSEDPDNDSELLPRQHGRSVQREPITGCTEVTPTIHVPRLHSKLVFHKGTELSHYPIRLYKINTCFLP